MAEEQKAVKSLDDIAALIAENTLKMRGITSDEEPLTDDSEDDVELLDPSDSTDDTDSAEDNDRGSENTDDDDDPADDDEVLSEDEPDTSGESETDDDELFLSDDDLVALGEETDEDFEEVSLGTLKQTYLADKTIAAKVEEQNEATRNALLIRSQAEDESHKLRAAAESIINTMGTQLLQPLVNPPNETLKTSNPQLYIQQNDLYTQDQQRIADARKMLVDAFDQHGEQQRKAHQTRKQQEFQILHTKVPALNDSDPKVKAQASQDILDAAEFYGFTADDVNGAADHRIFRMAYDAQQYRKMMSNASVTTKGNTKITPKEKLEQKRTKTRTLRSQNTTAKSRQTAQARRIKTLKNTAQKSGKVDDVANFIAASRSNK